VVELTEERMVARGGRWVVVAAELGFGSCWRVTADDRRGGRGGATGSGWWCGKVIGGRGRRGRLADKGGGGEVEAEWEFGGEANRRCWTAETRVL
jgi:hypothetical protein